MAEATNSALLWRNIKNAAIITCRVSAGVQLSALALTQVNSLLKLKSRKITVDCAMKLSRKGGSHTTNSLFLYSVKWIINFIGINWGGTLVWLSWVWVVCGVVCTTVSAWLPSRYFGWIGDSKLHKSVNVIVFGFFFLSLRASPLMNRCSLPLCPLSAGIGSSHPRPWMGQVVLA